jgi:membrane associated rhomboid family serine protease
MSRFGKRHMVMFPAHTHRMKILPNTSFSAAKESRFEVQSNFIQTQHILHASFFVILMQLTAIGSISLNVEHRIGRPQNLESSTLLPYILQFTLNACAVRSLSNIQLKLYILLKPFFNNLSLVAYKRIYREIKSQTVGVGSVSDSSRPVPSSGTTGEQGSNVP